MPLTLAWMSSGDVLAMFGQGHDVEAIKVAAACLIRRMDRSLNGASEGASNADSARRQKPMDEDPVLEEAGEVSETVQESLVPAEPAAPRSPNGRGGGWELLLKAKPASVAVSSPAGVARQSRSRFSVASCLSKRPSQSRQSDSAPAEAPEGQPSKPVSKSGKPHEPSSRQLSGLTSVFDGMMYGEERNRASLAAAEGNDDTEAQSGTPVFSVLGSESADRDTPDKRISPPARHTHVAVSPSYCTSGTGVLLGSPNVSFTQQRQHDESMGDEATGPERLRRGGDVGASMESIQGWRLDLGSADNSRRQTQDGSVKTAAAVVTKVPSKAISARAGLQPHQRDAGKPARGGKAPVVAVARKMSLSYAAKGAASSTAAGRSQDNDAQPQLPSASLGHRLTKTDVLLKLKKVNEAFSKYHPIHVPTCSENSADDTPPVTEGTGGQVRTRER